jgi:hypothetical protein
MGGAALILREIPDTPYRASPRAPGDDGTSSAIRLVEDNVSAEVVPAAVSSQAEAAAPVEPDVIEELGDEIATLSAHVAAATHRLLVLIAEFDGLRGWELAGQRSCAHWLAVRTGEDLSTAREKVRAGLGTGHSSFADARPRVPRSLPSVSGTGTSARTRCDTRTDTPRVTFPIPAIQGTYRRPSIPGTGAAHGTLPPSKTVACQVGVKLGLEPAACPKRANTGCSMQRRTRTCQVDYP